MEKENYSEMLDHTDKISALITKTVIDYCKKSDTPVDITHVLKALSDVMGANLAAMTQGWSDAQVEKCINVVFNHIVNTMNDCKNSSDEDDNPS
jgi:hypothetical protein